MSALSSIYACKRSRGDVFTIGDGNQFVGDEVEVTWLRPWERNRQDFMFVVSSARPFQFAVVY